MMRPSGAPALKPAGWYMQLHSACSSATTICRRPSPPPTLPVNTHVHTRSFCVNNPQPDTFTNLKWTIAQMTSFTPAPQLLADGAATNPRTAPYYTPAGSQKSWALPARQPDRRIILQVTIPLLQVNGWVGVALNNVASSLSPTCKPLMDLVYKDPSWAQKNALPADSSTGLNASLYFTPMGGNPRSWSRPGSRVQVGWRDVQCYAAVMLPHHTQLKRQAQACA